MPETPTASNELVVSGAITKSGVPFLMTDPHLPTHGAFWNRGTALYVSTPELRFAGLVTPGSLIFMIGQGYDPNSNSAVGLTGTSNAHTPSNVWVAPTDGGLNYYQTYKTLSDPGGVRAYDATDLDGVIIRNGTHGRLIGYWPDYGLGIQLRVSKDFDFQSHLFFWKAFQSFNPDSSWF